MSEGAIMSVGSLVRKVRLGYGLSIQEFADKLGVEKGSVSNWENNKRQPRFPTIRKLVELARAIDINLVFEDFVADESSQNGGTHE